MKAHYLWVFLLLSGCTLTGLVISDAPVLEITEQIITEDRAIIQWKTNASADATFLIGDRAMSFNDSRRFTADIGGLEPGKTYAYSIVVCEDERCRNHYGRFTTKGSGMKGLTGAVAGLEFVASGGKLMPLLMYGIVGILAGIIVVSSMASMPYKMRSGKMNKKLRTASQLLVDGHHTHAKAHYESARVLYEKLDMKRKKQNYEPLLDVYHQLTLQSRAVEANSLVDKYVQGTISEEELDRLRDLLSR